MGNNKKKKRKRGECIKERGNRGEIALSSMKYFELFTTLPHFVVLSPPQFTLFLSPLFLYIFFSLILSSLHYPSLWVAYHHPLLTKKPELVRLLFDTHTHALPGLSHPYLPFTGNEEIENQLRRDKVMAKNEIKMLLLGAGESGKVSLPPVIIHQ